MIEREIKYIIDHDTYLQIKCILESISISTHMLQINYYYDTPNYDLNANGRTLRIRQKNDSLFLQYKYDKKYSGIEKICEEFELNITHFVNPISSEILPESYLNVENYYYIGNLVTERFDYHLKKAVISLDKNYYLGKVDYEIEIEYENISEATEIINLLSLKNTENIATEKYRRFMMIMCNLKNGGNI